MANVPRGDPIGQAAERTGQIAQGMVMEKMAVDRQREERAIAEQQQKDEAAREAALRVKTLTVMGGAEDSLKDLHDEVTQGVLSGSVPKEKAEKDFTERSTKMLQGLGEDLPEDRRALIQAQLQRQAAQLGNGVRKAITQRDREDVTSGIRQTLEFLQRDYRTDPGKATQRASDLIDQLGPHSTMNPDQLSRLKQGWKEDTQYTAGFELFSAARNDRKALDAAAKAISTGLPDIDPQKRASLLDRIEGAKLVLDQKAELAAQRAQREAERVLKRAEAEFQTFQALADKGTALAPEYLDKVMQSTAGTPYQAGVRALAQQARETGGFAAQPVAVQQATLDQINTLIAQRGRTPELDRRKEQVERVLSGSRQDLERDPLRAGLERGVITAVQPLQMGSGVQTMVQQLQQRLPSVERVGMWAGRPVSPMTADEAAQFKMQLDALPVKERSGMVAAVAQAIGPQAAQGLAKQLNEKDKALALSFGYAGASTTANRLTSELILKGQQARSDGTSTKGDKQPEVKAAGWRAFAAQELAGVFADERTTAQIRDAAELIMHGMASEAGGRLSRDDMARALRLAVGGELVDHNGRKVPIPAGKTADDLERTLERIKPEAIAPSGQVRVNGMPVPAAEFVRTLPGQKLVPVGPGRYGVEVNGRLVVTDQGAPVVIKLD